MKLFAVALFSLITTTVANASCYDVVDSRLKVELKRRGHSYHGIEQKFGGEVVEILKDSDELTSEQKRELGRLLQSRSFEFFYLTATAPISAGYQQILAVSKSSCATYRRYTTYVE